MYGFGKFARVGSLMVYGASIPDLFHRAALEEPTKFELVINLKTAKALGLTIPPSLLARADALIR